ncbi:MAG TPA: SRPBCC family protein [Rickettsiales bacterium]|nr:SRPBCC family protein [Rickettsiales bacterium]
MASITKEILVNVTAEKTWDAIRDVGNLHTRLVRGFVTNTRMEEGARIVTFANGMEVRELIVDMDEQQRRLVWSAQGGRSTHHNASVQVFAEGKTCRIVWIADFLPHEIKDAIDAMMEAGIKAIKTTLESDIA